MRTKVLLLYVSLICVYLQYENALRKEQYVLFEEGKFLCSSPFKYDLMECFIKISTDDTCLWFYRNLVCTYIFMYTFIIEICMFIVCMSSIRSVMTDSLQRITLWYYSVIINNWSWVTFTTFHNFSHYNNIIVYTTLSQVLYNYVEDNGYNFLILWFLILLIHIEQCVQRVLLTWPNIEVFWGKKLNFINEIPFYTIHICVYTQTVHFWLNSLQTSTNMHWVIGKYVFEDTHFWTISY